jgi:hypothetical protein
VVGPAVRKFVSPAAINFGGFLRKRTREVDEVDGLSLESAACKLLLFSSAYDNAGTSAARDSYDLNEPPRAKQAKSYIGRKFARRRRRRPWPLLNNQSRIIGAG